MSAKREARPGKRKLGQLDLDAVREPFTLLLGPLRRLVNTVYVDGAEAWA